MPLLTSNPVRKGTATNADVLGFKAEYNYEYEDGKKPVFIRATATKEGDPVVYEAALFLESKLFQTTTHGVESTTDFAIFTHLAKDLFDIAAGL